MAEGNLLASAYTGFWEITPTGVIVQDIFTNAVGTWGGCFDPAGAFFLTDPNRHLVQKYAPSGKVVTDSYLTMPSQPTGCRFDPAGNMWITSQGGTVLYELTTGGSLLTFAVATDSAIPIFGADGCTLYYASRTAPNQIQRFDVCTLTQEPSLPVSADPTGLAALPGGDLLMTFAYPSQTVTRLTSAGEVVAAYDMGYSANNIALDPDGTTFWVSCLNGDRFQRRSLGDGSMVRSFSVIGGAGNSISVVGEPPAWAP